MKINTKKSYSKKNEIAFKFETNIIELVYRFN